MSDCHSGSVSMASISVLVIFALTCLRVGCATSFVKMNCISEINGQYGQTSVLECKISTSEEVQDPKITWLSWQKDGDKEPLLLYSKQTLEAKPGYSLAQQSWETSMDVSLRIANTAVQHEGAYTCQVMVSSGEAKGRSSLHVTATYSVPTITSEPKKLTSRTGGDLQCHTSGGYPKGQIRWFDGVGQEMTENAIANSPSQTGEGLFQLSSRLNLQKGFNFSNCICAVFNANGGREQEATFEFPPQTEGSKALNTQDQLPLQIKVVAPVVVIGSCVVGLLLVLLVCRRKRRYHHPHDQTHEAEPPEGNAYVEDQKTAVV